MEEIQSKFPNQEYDKDNENEDEPKIQIDIENEESNNIIEEGSNKIIEEQKEEQKNELLDEENKEHNDIENEEPKNKEEEPLVYISEANQTSDKVTQYVLKGKLCPNDLFRRYSDFFILRQKLLSRWPGITIPNLPPKVIFGSSTDKTTVRIRKRLLNNFCIELTKKKYFMDSEEVKLFFTKSTTPPDLHTKLSNLPELKYNEIMKNYLKYFSKEMNYGFTDCESQDFKVFTHQDYVEFTNFIEKWMALLKNIKDQMLKYSLEKKESIRNNYRVFRALEEYEKSSLMDYADGDSNQLVFFNVKNSKLTEKVISYTKNIKNPYQIIYEWIEDREMELMSMTDALTSFNNLLHVQAKIEDEINSLKNKIKNLEVGKRGFLDIIRFKKTDELLPTSKAELNEKNEKLNSVKEILKMLNHRFAKEKADLLANITKQFYETVKDFAASNVNNNKINKELWEDVN